MVLFCLQPWLLPWAALGRCWELQLRAGVWDVWGDLDLEQGENEMHQSECEEVELSKMKLFGLLRGCV